MYDDMMIQELNDDQLELTVGGGGNSASPPNNITINNTNTLSLTATLSANGSATSNPSQTANLTSNPSATGFTLSFPITCLSAETRIATPQGEVQVTDLQENMLVWTVSRNGEKVAMPIVRTTKSKVASTHTVVHVVLTDGREVCVSGAHPTADGRTCDQLQVGDSYAGAVVTTAEVVPYTSHYTYDLLPAGETGYYFANGILMGSTLMIALPSASRDGEYATVSG
jgi:hypothetical protein